MFKKIFLFCFIGGLILSLVFFIRYKKSAQQNETTGVYKNQEFGFSFEYPSRWTIMSQLSNEGNQQFIFTAKPYTYGEYNVGKIIDGYFEVNVTQTSYWFELDTNKKRRYASVNEMFEYIEEERKLTLMIPGPPSYRRTPIDPFVPGVVEIQGVRTYENNTTQYWGRT